jgi:hypothetical protein
MRAGLSTCRYSDRGKLRTFVFRFSLEESFSLVTRRLSSFAGE